MKNSIYFLVSFFLLSVTSLYANVALPSLYFLLGISSVSYVITIIGFLLEYTCICIATRANTFYAFSYAFLVTFLMNLFSAVIGLIFKLLSIDSYYIKLHDLIGLKGNNPVIGSLTANDIGFGIALWIMLTTISTILEFFVARIAFRKVPVYRLLFWTFIANALSNGFGIFCLGAYKYLYGSFPFATVSDYFMHKLDY